MYIYGIMRHGDWKRQPLLGNSTITTYATMGHFTPRSVTNGSTAGNGVFCAIRADSYVTNKRTVGSGFFCWILSEERPSRIGAVEVGS
jgi:hypothetical protein